MSRRRTIWVTHGHINNIFTAPASRHFELGSDIEYIRWQPLDAGKPFHPKSLVVGPKWPLFAVQQNPII
jgi:hypothetical protein